MNRKTYLRLAIISFKYAPIITAFVMIIHMFLLIFGYRWGFAETLCGMSILPTIVTYFLSKGLGFCKMHRMFIDYTFKMFLCIQVEKWIGFGVILPIMHWTMLILGIGIFIYFFINIKKFISNCDKNINLNCVNVRLYK